MNLGKYDEKCEFILRFSIILAFAVLTDLSRVRVIDEISSESLGDICDFCDLRQ